jgi:hypothetical protein
MGMAYGFPCLCITLISVACSQFQKLKAAILDIGQEHNTTRHGPKDQIVRKTANCILQDELNACIRHHQEIMT